MEGLIGKGGGQLTRTRDVVSESCAGRAEGGNERRAGREEEDIAKRHEGRARRGRGRDLHSW